MNDVCTESSLDEQLASFENDSEWVVLETYKQKDGVLTQKVVKKTGDGETFGPYVRKEFSQQSKQGSAYERVWQEQLNGNVLKHCPKIVDYYEYAQQRVVILDYVDGVTLEQYIRENELTAEQIRYLFARICDAVAELHTTFAQPLIHRDLKPTNIIVKDDDVFIIDLGIARFSKGDMTPDTTQFGTPTFAPPEQYGFGETSIESDIYALGMMLYFMLTKKLSNSTLRDNSTFEADVPTNFRSVLLKATSFDPQERFHSAYELKRALLTSTDTEAVKSKKFSDKLRDKFGTIWNICVVAFWIVLMAGVVGGMVQPNAEFASHSPAYRSVGYIGITGVPLTIYCFVILEKSKLKKRFPFMKKCNGKTLLTLCFVAFFMMVISAIIINFL